MTAGRSVDVPKHGFSSVILLKGIGLGLLAWLVGAILLAVLAAPYDTEGDSMLVAFMFIALSFVPAGIWGAVNSLTVRALMRHRQPSYQWGLTLGALLGLVWFYLGGEMAWDLPRLLSSDLTLPTGARSLFFVTWGVKANVLFVALSSSFGAAQGWMVAKHLRRGEERVSGSADDR